MRQYDVTEPRKPKLTGSVRIGGIARRTPHPSGNAFAGGPQMVEISRDGKRVYSDELALFHLGQSILSRWRPRSRGHGDRQSHRRPRIGEGLLGELPRRLPRPSDPARRRRLLDGFFPPPIRLSGSGVNWAVSGLWLAVIASGLYHGVNPGMGWPLAVSTGMMERVRGRLWRRSGACGRPSARHVAHDPADSRC